MEWVIAIFFVGRFLSEFKQYNNRKTSKRLEKRKSLSRKHEQYVYQQSGSDHEDNLDLPVEVEDYHSRLIFSTMGKYFMYVSIIYSKKTMIDYYLIGMGIHSVTVCNCRIKSQPELWCV